MAPRPTTTSAARAQPSRTLARSPIRTRGPNVLPEYSTALQPMMLPAPIVIGPGGGTGRVVLPVVRGAGPPAHQPIDLANVRTKVPWLLGPALRGERGKRPAPAARHANQGLRQLQEVGRLIDPDVEDFAAGAPAQRAQQQRLHAIVHV